MLTHERLMGGSDISSYNSTDTHNLIDTEAWGVYVLSGTGAVDFVLPDAKGLPICTEFRLSFSGSGMTAVIKDWDGNTLTIYDLTGTARTDIDFAAPKWGLAPGLICILIDNSTTAGTWRCASWSSYS
jgi:hypothetical protein